MVTITLINTVHCIPVGTQAAMRLLSKCLGRTARWRILEGLHGFDWQVK